MTSRKWSVPKAAGLGALAGVLLSIYNAVNEGQFGTAPPSFFVGLFVGGAVTGAVLFALAAVVRNLFAKRD